MTIAHWPARPKLTIHGTSDTFPISRVFGVGRNYSNHPADEKKVADDIVLFTKDAYAVSDINQSLSYPTGTTHLRYEVELVIAVGRSGRLKTLSDENDSIFGYGVGIDFTKYDVQDAAKKAGRPWDSGKSFPGCAPCSALISAKNFTPVEQHIWLNCNNKTAQSGQLNQLIWTIPELLSIISERFGLLAGDLIFSGTPEGVGMAERGDCLSGGVDGLAQFEFSLI